ncbi:MAG: 50S ribosomal protein L18 [Methanomassiliicoccaceae archaeon]|jgi:large subunit ribosomal protein L18|nr:50S ribosomal protein L18 [Methanomassiliicoccaceae archaeon]
MATGPRYKVPFRRRRDNRTDYYKRKRLLAGGELRAVVRRSSRNVTIQFAKFGMDGDSILTASTSAELKAFGWEHACSNIPAAYLTGYLAGTKAKKAGIGKAVLDIGMQTPAKGAVLFAALSGILDAGVDVPHGDVLPTDERLFGDHIGGGLEADVNSVRVAIGGEKRERKQAVKPKTADAKKAASKIPERPAAKKGDAKAAPAKGDAKAPAAKKGDAKAPAKDAKAPAKKKKEAE